MYVSTLPHKHNAATEVKSIILHNNSTYIDHSHNSNVQFSLSLSLELHTASQESVLTDIQIYIFDF